MSASDKTLERLLILDGDIFGLDGGYWVEMRAKRVPASTAKPHGVNYSLCLCSPDGKRQVCFDNAHPVTTGRKPSKRTGMVNDHVHVAGKTKPYPYVDAETLLTDFWTEVEKVLKAKGAM